MTDSWCVLSQMPEKEQPKKTPTVEPDTSPQSAAESALQQSRYPLLERITLIVSLLYVGAGLSHFVLLEEGQWVMFGLAMLCSLSLLATWNWIRRHPEASDMASLVALHIYVSILVHSLVRLHYSHHTGDVMFVGLLAVAMALIPGNLPTFIGSLLTYLVGWSIIFITQKGMDDWGQFAGPLILIGVASMAIRILEIRRDLHIQRLQFLDRKRRSALEASQQRLRHAAYHDALTGMPNRAHFSEELHNSFEAARMGEADAFAVLYMDLDRFKVVNDSLGHQMGDRLLQALSRRLKRFVRPQDTVARFGGDEFGVLLRGVTHAGDALIVAERLHDVLEEPFLLDAYEVQIGGSIGIAMYRQDYGDVEEMLRDADIAMYKAKRGPNDQLVFDGNMHSEAVQRLELEVDLRRALKSDELRVYYQPIVDLVSGHTLGFEALVRWQHPERGLLTPGQFLGMAEETGLILTLGEFVFARACSDLKKWLNQPDVSPSLFVSINVSARQFSQSDFEPFIAHILEESHLPAENLWVELTETAIIEQPERAESRIRTLRELGVSVVVDDFGVGYSSLSYLQRFPFSVVKLDRSFISARGQGWRIVEGMLTLAAGLGISVVAEGIEEDHQIRMLEHLGCVMGQGFYFARPMPADAVLDFLSMPQSFQPRRS